MIDPAATSRCCEYGHETRAKMLDEKTLVSSAGCNNNTRVDASTSHPVVAVRFAAKNNNKSKCINCARGSTRIYNSRRSSSRTNSNPSLISISIRIHVTCEALHVRAIPISPLIFARSVMRVCVLVLSRRVFVCFCPTRRNSETALSCALQSCLTNASNIHHNHRHYTMHLHLSTNAEL